MTKIAPWIALTIIGVATSVAYIAVSFIEGNGKILIRNPLEIYIGKDHKPAPTINYHIKKEGVWGL